MNGIINVFKEQGYTSHDVVAKLRGILHMKKIGHTGTLDPDAIGVLPVCLGKGTKLVELITDWTKTYEAVMLLGTTTDTQDISGKVLEKRSVDSDELQIMDAINSFVGDYAQVPPMFSALKHNGQKLYELARKGIEVEREPRMIHINSIHINEMSLRDEEKTVTFTVECSKGTYIRTLCDDIGKKLGCGACMMKLSRTRVGSFAIDNSLSLGQIEALVLRGEINNYVVNVDDMFPDYEKVVVAKEYNILIYNGNKFTTEAIKVDESDNIGVKQSAYLDMQNVRVYDEKDSFIGVYRYEDGIFVPVKMFFSSIQDNE